MSSEPPLERTKFACGACKRHKRRCDKDVPSCGLCRRTGRHCEYPSEQPIDSQAATAAELETLRARLSELEDHVASTLVGGSSPAASSFHSVQFKEGHTTSSPGHVQPQTRYPAALFLDSYLFVAAGRRLPEPQVTIPLDILTILTQNDAILDASHRYFNTIHSWLPIVSKKRMDLGVSMQNAGPDVAMLFLAMKLATAEFHDVALHSTTTAFLANLQNEGAISFICLQAMVIVAQYQYAHAIYPAAWMTIGACARYAQILELSWQDRGTAVMTKSFSWTETEERRRVWWAIFILDRLASMGSRRAFLLPPPPADARLPVNDSLWEIGDVTRSINYAVSINAQVHQSHYPRLCQAAGYASRAVDATSRQSTPPNSVAEVMSLAEEIRNFSAILDSDATANAGLFVPLLAARCLAHSALFIALDKVMCPEGVGSDAGFLPVSNAKTEEELAFQNLSMQFILKAGEEVRVLATSVVALVEQGGYLYAHICPFILDAIYAATSLFRWLLAEGGPNEIFLLSVSDLDRALREIGTQWNLGLKYAEMATFYGSATHEAG